MAVITDKQMQSSTTKSDVWITESGPRGAGRFLGRITPSGERAFYFRYTTNEGNRDTLRVGLYDPKGRAGLKLAEARLIADEWSKLYQSEIKNLRTHFVQLETDKRKKEEFEKNQSLIEASTLLDISMRL
jgi:hypothetical protein